MSYALKKGTTSKILLVYALDATDMRSGKTGLSSQTPDSSAAYIREGEAQVQRIPLVEGKLGEHRAGSFVEIDSKLLPGVYQFGVPDEMLAAGAETVTLMLKFPGAVIEPISIHLVAYDPQDADRLGMSALGPEGRRAALRGAFPRLTAKELGDALMEVKQVGNMAQAAARSAQPYRRHIVGLPLQRSLFGQAARAATTIGLPGLSSELDFPARLDENGDLFLDRSQVAALTKALPSWFTPETLELMHTTHVAACDALVDASENAARVAASLDGAARKLSEDLANRMALVLAYGILSKFVPDVLLRALADAGDVEPPPFPEKSAGAELMQNTFALYQACCALNYTPQRLQREWPRVSPEVFQLVSEFCNRQTGFGPLAWDSPGYEDPNYVVRLLHSAFDEVDAEQVRRRLSFAKRPAVARSTRRCANENRCPQACPWVLAGFSGTGDLVCAPRVLCRHDPAPAAAGGGISPENPVVPS